MSMGCATKLFAVCSICQTCTALGLSQLPLPYGWKSQWTQNCLLTINARCLVNHIWPATCTVPVYSMNSFPQISTTKVWSRKSTFSNRYCITALGTLCPDAVARILANGSAAFFESCNAIGWKHSVESPSMVDPQWNIWYWGSKWILHTVGWSAVGCEWGTTSVYFGITYVCFIPSRLPVFAVEPQYLLQYLLFLWKVSFEGNIQNLQKFHVGLKFEWGL